MICEAEASPWRMTASTPDVWLEPGVQVQSMLCHSYWDTSPLNLDAAERFVRAVPEEDVAVMISAKSHTPLDVRRVAIACGPASSS